MKKSVPEGKEELAEKMNDRQGQNEETAIRQGSRIVHTVEAEVHLSSIPDSEEDETKKEIFDNDNSEASLNGNLEELAPRSELVKDCEDNQKCTG